VKLFTTLLIACFAGLAVYAVRRRIGYALKVGGIVYLVVLFGRLVLSAGSLADRWDDVLWPILIMGAAWVILWFATTIYRERRAADKQR
jgi:hypothetical protein